MPADIVTRQVDVTTNMLATPYCPRYGRGERVLHSGHGSVAAVRRPHGSTLYPDTSGTGGVVPIDTSRRFRDSAIFALPPRDTTKKVPRRDTIRPKIPPDTLSS